MACKCIERKLNIDITREYANAFSKMQKTDVQVYTIPYKDTVLYEFAAFVKDRPDVVEVIHYDKKKKVSYD